MYRSSYTQVPIKSSAISNFGTDDTYCFVWSNLAHLHPCENTNPNRVSNNRPYFNELNNDVFDSTDGFECNYVTRFETVIIVAAKNFELPFYKEGVC